MWGRERRRNNATNCDKNKNKRSCSCINFLLKPYLGSAYIKMVSLPVSLLWCTDLQIVYRTQSEAIPWFDKKNAVYVLSHGVHGLRFVLILSYSPRKTRDLTGAFKRTFFARLVCSSATRLSISLTNFFTSLFHFLRSSFSSVLPPSSFWICDLTTTMGPSFENMPNWGRGDQTCGHSVGSERIPRS